MLDSSTTSIESKIMANPGLRTAPTVGIGTANKNISTVHLLDASGDNGTDALITAATPTEALVEAWAAAYQDATQASIWKISLTQEWVGDEDTSNAKILQRSSVKDGINLLYTDLANLQTQTPRLVAPIVEIMQGNQDIPLLGQAELALVITSVLNILTGFQMDSGQYTQRRERKNNPRIKS